MAEKGPQQIKADERKAEKLKAIKEQIAGGKLKVRQMTAAERKAYPKPAPKPVGKAKRGDATRQRGRG